MASIATGKGTVTFNSDDLPRGGTIDNNALYLDVTYVEIHVPLYLVDNRLAINVCPWKTTKRLGIKESQLLPPSTHLKAYDNSKRLVLGTILFPINVTPIEKNIEFHVLDIPTTFTLLLGHPWLHEH